VTSAAGAGTARLEPLWARPRNVSREGRGREAIREPGCARAERTSLLPFPPTTKCSSASSLGVFAVQLTKHFGAHGTGACGPSNVDLVKSLGADEVIDYTIRDFADSDVRYDVICDKHPGNESRRLTCRTRSAEHCLQAFDFPQPTSQLVPPGSRRVHQPPLSCLRAQVVRRSLA
jgi:hypothetical protein